MYFIQLYFICHPSDSTVSEDAGIEPRADVTLALAALAVQSDALNHSARSHPQNVLAVVLIAIAMRNIVEENNGYVVFK
jgi:hypothetical protein